jgi:hypothetical protein
MLFSLITAILFGAALSIAAPCLAPGAEQEDKSHGPNPAAHTECKFADGGTISIDNSGYTFLVKTNPL